MSDFRNNRNYCPPSFLTDIHVVPVLSSLNRSKHHASDVQLCTVYLFSLLLPPSWKLRLAQSTTVSFQDGGSNTESWYDMHNCTSEA